MNNSTSLLDYLKSYSYSDQTLDQVEDVFNRLGLPLPSEGEFYKAKDDQGAVVLMSRFATALRLTHNSRKHFSHTRILQPLISAPAEELRIDLNPGVLTPFYRPDYTEWSKVYAEMEAELRRDGIGVTDFNGDNGGRLPAPFDKHHIFIDPGALRALTKSALEAAETLKSLESKDPQVLLFGSLKTMFQQAFSDQPEQKLQEAWRKCIMMKAQGLLVANWENSGFGGKSGVGSSGTVYNIVHNAAALYDQKLQALVL